MSTDAVEHHRKAAEHFASPRPSTTPRRPPITAPGNRIKPRARRIWRRAMFIRRASTRRRPRNSTPGIWARSEMSTAAFSIGAAGIP